MLPILTWPTLSVWLTFSAPRGQLSQKCDFSLLCLGRPAEGTGYEARRAARSSLPYTSPSPLPPPASGRPVRDFRVNMGYCTDLPLESDVNSVGLLPSSFVKVVTPSLHKLRPADYRFSWVQDSHFCSGGGKGLFFSVSPDRILPAGTLTGSTRAATPKTSTLPTPKPSGGLLKVTMSSLLPARLTL
jgi:hypothetical protein